MAHTHTHQHAPRPLRGAQVLKRYHPLALRWFLVTTHYRAPVNYSAQALDEASSRLYYVLQSMLEAQAALAAGAWACSAWGGRQGPCCAQPPLGASCLHTSNWVSCARSMHGAGWEP